MSQDFRSMAAAVLALHGTYTWNKSRTRIRCNGEGCALIMDAPDEPAAVTAFAHHQAEQLPEPPSAEPVLALNAPEVAEEEVAPVPSAASAASDDGDEVEGDQGTGASDPDETPDEGAEPDEATESSLTTPAPKFRRNTKALTATIAELKKGDRVRATFNQPRYGQFTVEGTVLKGGAGLDRGQLSVAGWYINLNARAAKALQDLTILAAAGKHEFAIPPVTPLPEHIGIGG